MENTKKKVAKSKLIKYVIAVADLNVMDNEIFAVHAINERDALIHLFKTYYADRVRSAEFDENDDIDDIINAYHGENLCPSVVYNKIGIWLEHNVEVYVQEVGY